MDNHPIPQDVTGFQFKLIGNMTIKQFAYVAFGVVLAVITYYSPSNIFIKILLVPIFGTSGIVIAFLPIEGRPVDTMFFNFIKALFAPNQFVYQKTGRQFSFIINSYVKQPVVDQRLVKQEEYERNKQKQLQTLLSAYQSRPPNKLDEKENALVKAFSATTTVMPTVVSQLVKQQVAQPVRQLRIATSKLPEPTKSVEIVDKQKPTLLEQQMQTLKIQKQQLDQQLKQLQEQLVVRHDEQQAPQAQQIQEGVRVVPQDMARSLGLSYISDSPNVITGIVKDSRGNVLPGMLVEIKDKDGNPVRAFKTNTLGQFASATPLAQGAYTIELEDPKKQHSFGTIQIVANNQILLPIEIVSHDAREALRKDLFN